MDVPQTDSGYPTPRDEQLPSSSRSLSPITSTPLRNVERKSLRDHFENFEENRQKNEQSPEQQKQSIIRIIKPYMEMSKEMKRLKKENESLREESLRFSRSVSPSPSTVPPEIPKLIFGDMKLKDEIKRELTASFVKIEADPVFFEKKLDEMIEQATKKITATAYIDIKTDADAQTESECNFHEAELRIELDDLTNRLETTEKEKDSIGKSTV
ncbi:unnamed protein product [Caenorhabditis angaria]|uniref:Uncharacterized protein n=1 Tax=Caenorhabditis angaria TaxID=860376 RepID=A0A9P1IIA7_9PELO|nr:unnamed protein product [Caenorhabditis angaria]